MPEGFKSIADLQVVVDANTEKLNLNMTAAHNLVQRFAGEGSQALGKFDAAVAVTSVGIKSMLGPIGAVISALQVVSGLWDKYGARIEQAAGIAGMGEEWKKLTESATGFAGTLTGAIPDAIKIAREGMSASAHAATDDMESAEDSLVSVSAKGHEAAASVDGLKVAADNVKPAFAAAGKAAAETLQEIDDDADETDDKIEAVSGSISSNVTQSFATAAVASADYFAGVRSNSAKTADQVIEDAKRAQESWGKKAARAVGDAFDEVSGLIVRTYKPEDKMALREMENDMKLSAEMIREAQNQIRRGFASGEMPEWQMSYYVDRMGEEMARLQAMRDRYNEAEKPKSDFEKAIDADITAIIRKTDVLGLSAVEMAAYNEEQKLLALLSKEDREATERETEAMEAAQEAARDYVRIQQDISVNKSIAAETDAINNRREAIKLSGIELDLHNTRQKLMAIVTKDGRDALESELIAINAVVKARREELIEKADITADRAIKAETDSIHQKRDALGLAGVELEVYTERQRLMTMATRDGHEATQDQIASISIATVEFRRAAEARATAGIDKQLQAETAAINQRREALGLEGPTLDAYNERAKLMALVTKDGRAATESEIASINKLAAATRAISQYKADKAQDKKDDDAADREALQIERIMLNLETEMRGIQRKTVALSQSTAEAARSATVEKGLAEIRRLGREATDEERVAIEAHGNAIADATQKYLDGKTKLEQLQAATQVVTRSMEQAFQKMMSGTKVNWNEMVSSMLSDLAMLVFKQGVTQPLAQLLTGGGPNGGSGIFGSIFGGFKAEGGPVDPSQAYIVGERGPEIFMPSSAGNIVPNHALGGGGSTTIHMPLTIDARGAYPESIEQIKAAVRDLHSSIPGRVVDVVRESRERGVAL